MKNNMLKPKTSQNLENIERDLENALARQEHSNFPDLARADLNGNCFQQLTTHLHSCLKFQIVFNN